MIMQDMHVVGIDRLDPAAPTYQGRPLADPSEPVFDQGLAFDVATLMGRRHVLKAIGLTGIGAAIAACAPGAVSTSLVSPGASAPAASVDAADCAVIPEETAGPFPGDGSNGPDILSQSGVVRSDIRSSFGSSTTVADGVPMMIRLELVDVADECAPYAGAAVYVWHCDAEGRYSMYSPGVEGENYLRGVQEAGADGAVEFMSVFPACYPGRWPHVHFEVYPSLDQATDVSYKIATSQIALPAETCAEVYATDGYQSSASTLAGVSLARDNVFGEDGGVHQSGTVSGSIQDGLAVTLVVPVDLA
jgi:protocatechuate 3,4-dioxygenase beta subunit